jgi:Patatin-like phospholipase
LTYLALFVLAVLCARCHISGAHPPSPAHPTARLQLERSVEISNLGRISRALHLIGPEPTSEVLSLASVLEEEYLALHPASAPEGGAVSDVAFQTDDIVDFIGFARALVLSSPNNPLHDIGRYVLRESPELATDAADALRRSPPSAGPESIALTAAALNGLVVGERDLRDAPEFAPVLLFLQKHDDGTLDQLGVAVRNRLMVDTAFSPFVRTRLDRRMLEITARMRTAGHSALCLSGGGIRSASFALGIVQGLAMHERLRRFEYLSTVSGGGYTGSWLSAWMQRDGVERVHEQLKPRDAAKDDFARRDVEPSAIRHVRSFSSFLAPRFGFFSADMWTVIATIARNIFLIWLVVLPVLAAAVIVPRFIVSCLSTSLHMWRQMGWDPGWLMVGETVVGAALAITGISFVQRNLYSYSGRTESETKFRAPVTMRQFVAGCYVPLMLAVAILSHAWQLSWSLIQLDFEGADPTGALTAAVTSFKFAASLIALHPERLNTKEAAFFGGTAFWGGVYVFAWLFSVRRAARRGDRAGNARVTGFVLALLCGGVAGAIGAASAMGLFGLAKWTHSADFYGTFAVPTSLAGMLIATQVAVGVASHSMTDAERESNARFSAWLLIGLVSWTAVAGVTLLGPYLLIGATIKLKHLIGIAGLSGVLASGAAARSSSTPNTSGASGLMAKLRGAIVAVATPLFAIIVLVLVAMLNTGLLNTICAGSRNGSRDWCYVDHAKKFTVEIDHYTALVRMHEHGKYVSPGVVLIGLLGLGALAMIFARLIDTNRFSLHAMYRERLVRTFLGASRSPGERQPNPFTGFDQRDDLPIGDLWPPAALDVGEEAERASHPPLHVVNVTLNTVAGTDLATQNRKAMPFTFTSMHAGAAGVGYRRTRSTPGADGPLYGADRGVSLGTAMSISGAAASPNMGYHSSPAVTFLMTLFNARLGWWLGNPGPAGRETFNNDEPKYALMPILDEMFGRTTDHSPYVYLSDGGHFENLGLYEMIRRRCRFIVLADAGSDPECAFDDLGGAIRKIRVDFGVPIEFDGEIPIYPRTESDKPNGRYWAVAHIRYSTVDGGGTDHDGYLFYIKPAFYGREPRDVFSYAMSNPEFPHESTADQFFGEDQLESYRALGLFAVDQMFESQDPFTMQALEAWSSSQSSAPTLHSLRSVLPSVSTPRT